MNLLLDLVNILVEWLNCGIIFNALTRRACRVTRCDAPRLLSPNVLYEVYSLLCTPYSVVPMDYSMYGVNQRTTMEYSWVNA